MIKTGEKNLLRFTPTQLTEIDIKCTVRNAACLGSGGTDNPDFAERDEYKIKLIISSKEIFINNNSYCSFHEKSFNLYYCSAWSFSFFCLDLCCWYVKLSYEGFWI